MYLWKCLWRIVIIWKMNSWTLNINNILMCFYWTQLSSMRNCQEFSHRFLVLFWEMTGYWGGDGLFMGILWWFMRCSKFLDVLGYDGFECVMIDGLMIWFWVELDEDLFWGLIVAKSKYEYIKETAIGLMDIGGSRVLVESWGESTISKIEIRCFNNQNQAMWAVQQWSTIRARFRPPNKMVILGMVYDFWCYRIGMGHL